MDKQFITHTEIEVKDGVTYTTHYVNRPIMQGDPHGGTKGIRVNGIDKIIEIEKYIYTLINENE